jgi:hypothetical protein
MSKTTFTYPTIKTTAAIQMRLFKQLRESGHIFKAAFIKKTNNELRIMIFRFGVKKYVKGTGLKFDPLSKGLLPVFDMEKNEYRMLNLNSLMTIQYQGKTYQF